MPHTPAPPTAADIENWLREKIAHRLEVEPSAIDLGTFFDDLQLDSTEALVLAGELESWLGFELPTTALWYHPTIRDLAAFIAEEVTSRAPAV